MTSAIGIVLLGQAVYWSPLLFGRRCIGVGCFLWPIGFGITVFGIIDVLGALPA